MYELSRIKSVVEVKEENSEKPNKNEKVVDQDAYVFLGLFDLPHEPDRVYDEYGQEQDPCHDSVIDSILKEV